MPAKSDRRQSLGSACGSSVGIQTMVSNITGCSNAPTMSATTRSSLNFFFLGKKTRPLLSHHNFRLVVWLVSGNCCSRKTYQKNCPKFCWLLAKKTEKQCKSAWESLCCYCYKKLINQFSCPFESISLYLLGFYDKGFHYRTVSEQS